MKIIFILVILSLLLVSCVPTSTVLSTGISSGWEDLGGGLYRKLDKQMNIVCYFIYASSSGTALSCVKYND